MVDISVNDAYYLFFVVHLALVGFYALYYGVRCCYVNLADSWRRCLHRRRRPDRGPERDALTRRRHATTTRLTEVVVVWPIEGARARVTDNGSGGWVDHGRTFCRTTAAHRRSYGADDGRAGVVFVRAAARSNRSAGRRARRVCSQTVVVTLQPGDRRPRRPGTVMRVLPAWMRHGETAAQKHESLGAVGRMTSCAVLRDVGR